MAINEIQFRIALVQKGLSQNQLAKRLGVHPSVLSACVRGYRKIEEELCKRICRELQVDVAELFKNQDETDN